MKKINLLFSTLIIALVCLIISGATVAPAMQFQAMSLNTTSTTGLKGKVLFDGKGRYMRDRSDLEVGKFYQFFGYDWRLVFVNDTQNVATFWMADPYTNKYFDETKRSGIGEYHDGANIWTNGYTNTVWQSSHTAGLEGGKKDLGESDIRKFLRTDAQRVLGNANYKDKVVPGYVPGSNEDNATAKRTIKYLQYSNENLDQVEKDESELNQLTADYSLNDQDIWWLPSKKDLAIWGILDNEGNVLDENAIRWTETTISDYYAWLRDPAKNGEESSYIRVISPEKHQVAGDTEDTYFHLMPVKKAQYGVRPAIHMDITNITKEYQEHLNDNSSGNWWDDAWLKALFLTVSIMGIVGVSLVIVAVIVKARRVK